MEYLKLTDLVLRFVINIAAMVVLIFLIYYPRYKHKQTAISAALFNIFSFAVLSVLTNVNFSIAAGFGLFAILAMFTLRSEQINKTDIAYFFGCVSIAVITAVIGSQIAFVVLMIGMVLLGVFIIDHPSILRSVSQMTLTLDFIPEQFLSNPDTIKCEISKRLGVEILSYRIVSVCYVTEVIEVEVDFRHKEQT